MKEKVTLVSKKDLDIIWFNGGKKAGGSNINAHNNCCKIRHRDSGAEAQSTSERSSEQNLREAFKKLCKTPRFTMWLSGRLMELRTGETLAERVEHLMQPQYLKVEKLQDGQWVEWSEQDEKLYKNYN